MEKITGRPLYHIGLDPFYPDEVLSNEAIIGVDHHLFSQFNIVLTDYNQNFNKVIIIRDLRDMVISLSNFLKKGVWLKSLQDKLSGFSEQERIRWLMENYSSLFRSVHNPIQNAILWKNDPSVLVICFEDLVGEKGGGTLETQKKTIEQLSNHVNIFLTPKEIEEIALDLFGGTATFHEGKIGKWKDYFDEELNYLFKDHYGPCFEQLGYSFNVE